MPSIKTVQKLTKTVVDPGFQLEGGVLTSDADAFRRKHMRKRKSWVLLREGGGCLLHTRQRLRKRAFEYLFYDYDYAQSLELPTNTFTCAMYVR